MTVWEFAEFSVLPGREEAFVAHVQGSAGAIQAAGECGEIALHRAVDVESRYVLVVPWASLAAHREFVATPVFRSFFAELTTLVAEPGRVFHTEVVPAG